MADATGYGKAPLRSTWLKRSSQFYASPQQVVADIYGDWYFDGSALTGQIKAYLAGVFTAKPVKVWNGSAWVIKTLKRWNGSAWVATTY